MAAILATIDLRAPHSQWQEEVILFPHNVILIAGRRWGKTDAMVQRIFYHMTRRPGLYWWVGLTWRSASMKRAWRVMLHTARRLLRALGLDEKEHVNRSNYEIRLPGMGEIWFRTAENPASLAGEGVTGVVLDEVTIMREEVWAEYVQPTLLDTGGWAALTGVPKGRNWVYTLWHEVQNQPNWLCVHATTYDNPFIPKERIDALRATLPDTMFRQEILAEFVDVEGVIFRNVEACSTAQPLERGEPGHLYVYGIDWGKTEDYTVFSIIDPATRTQVYVDRFNRVEYGFGLKRLKALAERFPPQVIIAEGNSVGERLAEEMWAMGLPVQRFITTHQSKKEVIENLAIALESRTVTLLADPTQMDELRVFSATILPSGRVRYEAPPGMHDDTVIALALALYGCEHDLMFALA